MRSLRPTSNSKTWALEGLTQSSVPSSVARSLLESSLLVSSTSSVYSMSKVIQICYE